METNLNGKRRKEKPIADPGGKQTHKISQEKDGR